jgi:hypothetical protein
VSDLKKLSSYSYKEQSFHLNDVLRNLLFTLTKFNIEIYSDGNTPYYINVKKRWNFAEKYGILEEIMDDTGF